MNKGDEELKRRTVLGAGLVAAGSAALYPGSGLGNREPVVTTAQGRVRGMTAASGVHVFKGMRYGASTTGVLRFLPPAPPPTWSGVRDAFEYGDQSPQARTRLAGSQPMSDDCLRINVWTPGLDDARRPVMLWFHGGGFEAGTGSMPLYDGTNMARRGNVVVVTVNHRLNVFGHCYLGGLLGEQFQQSGNAGYLDLIAAMRWVRENIAGFGGNPDSVMIYGQSGGGRKVSLCYAGSDAAGLFHRGVVQSGSHLKIQTQEQANELSEQLLKVLDIPAKEARRLQTIDVETLTRAQLEVIASAGRRFSPVLDGMTFTTQPWLPEAPSLSSHIPMMLGTTRTELTNQMGGIPGIFDMDEAQAKARLQRFLSAEHIDEGWAIFQGSRPSASPSEVFFTMASARGYYLDQMIMAEQRVRAGGSGNTFVYRLMWRQPVEGGRRVSQHSLDLPFMFDNVATVPDITGPETAETRAMTNCMANSWIAFARTGDPNNADIPSWAPYDLEHRNTLLFDVPPVAVDDPYKAEREFITRFPSQQDGGLALHRRTPAT